MSTIKATHIQHPSAASPNFTLASDGTVSGGAGLGGLVHIHTETFASVSSVSIDDVFDATYDNYRVMIFFNNTGSADTNFRWRASGVDNATTSSYITTRFRVQDTTLQGNRYADNKAVSVGVSRPQVAGLSIDIIHPFQSVATTFMAHAMDNGGGTQADLYLYSGYHNQLSSYDGFSFFPNGGLLTGSLSVYGYANS
jgi:hypothetical protein